MIRKFLICLVCIVQTSIYAQNTSTNMLQFDEQKAKYLYHFAFDCIDKEYPNKPGHVLGDDNWLQPPRMLHPAFYGCFDWHSSVHGHWTLVTILSQFPEFEFRDEIIHKLKKNLTTENILQEVAYFDDPHNKDFERTYGWAWLLKLDEALHDWDDPAAKELQQNLQPLTQMIANKLSGFLDKLNYPIRVGEHTNTAFGLSFALDWADRFDKDLGNKIRSKATEYYAKDQGCPLSWEPGGFDFLSPCLQEASLMLKVLGPERFTQWINQFLPELMDTPDKWIKPAIVSDQSDGKLAHLDGLNYSRAWCLFEIGHTFNQEAMLQLAIQHFQFSYEKLDQNEYAGSHWLASFATYALIKAQKP